MRKPTGDAVSGLVLLMLCALGYWLTSRFPAVPPVLSQNVPPTFFPRLVLTCIAACSAFLLFTSGPSDTRTDKPPALVYVTAVIVLATPALIGLLGTWLVIAGLSAALPLLWRERRPVRILALALGLPVAVYLIFTLALGVRFPTGALGAAFSRAQ